MEAISYLVIIGFVLLWARCFYHEVAEVSPCDEDINWIDSKIDLVREIVRESALFPVDARLYDELRVTPEKTLERMSQAVGISGLTLSFDPSLKSPGIIEGGSRIVIRNENARNANGMGAILAHEVAHAVMHQKWQFPSMYLDNERLTDFCAVYLGFGKLMLNGHRIEVLASSSGKNSTALLFTESHFGYLPINSLVYAYNRYCDDKRVGIFQRIRGLKVALVKRIVLQRLFLKRFKPKNRRAFDEIILHCSFCKGKTVFQYQSVDLGLQKWKCSSCGGIKIREVVGRRIK